MTNHLRDQILAKPTRKQRTIRVDEWDTTIIVRELDARQRTAFMGTIDPAKGTADLTALVPYVVDLVRAPDGTALFEVADLDQLVRDHPGVVEMVLFEAFGLSDIGKGASEEALGNSVPTPS